MSARLICTLLIAISLSAQAEDPVDRSGEWDVNGPLGSPTHRLRFTTDEGTWMGVDVHPSGEQLIFDMLGDLYLLPIEGGQAARLTEGAGYDLQPRFSPDGNQVVFSSDRGGENSVWVADFDGAALSNYRNLNEGDSRQWGDANWMPDGEWLLARKRITDTSSIGVAELWMLHRDGGTGIQIVAPKGEVESFSASPDGRYIYFGASGPFTYDRNPYTDIWSINRFDRDTGEQAVVSHGDGNSASPVLSPDGGKLAFIRRVGTRSTLWIHELADGSERQLWDGLDRDQIEAFATHQVYPYYAFVPDGSAIVIYAGGRFARVPVDGGDVQPIEFTADIDVRYHEPLRQKHDPAPDTLKARLIRWPVIAPDGESMVFSALGKLYWMRLPDGVPTRVTGLDALEFSPTFAPDGRRLLFTTWSDDDGGALVEVNWRRGGPGSPRILYRSGTQLVNPAVSGDGKRIVVVAGSGASLRGRDLGDEDRHDILLFDGGDTPTLVTSTANRGSQSRVVRPTFSEDGARIWYIDSEDTGGDRGERKPPLTVLKSVRLDGSDGREHLKFRYAEEVLVSPDETRVAFTGLHNAYVAALPNAGAPVEIDTAAAAVPLRQLSYDGGEWVTWSHDGRFLSFGFADKVTRLRTETLELEGKPEPRPDSDDGIRVLDVAIGADGEYRFGAVAGDLESIREPIERAVADAAEARIDVTIDASAPWHAWHELEAWAGEAKIGIRQADAEAEPETADEGAAPDVYTIELTVPRAKPSGAVAFTGARIITMNGDEVIDNGTLLIRDNRIEAVGRDVAVPDDARVFDASGKTIMPGLIDVHAHMGYGVLDVNPQKEWRYYAILAYGVTTTHDPSASTQTVFSQSEMIESGVMVGPRVYSTGFILYGADNTDKAIVTSYADALSHVRRLKSLGAFSVKSYMQPQRKQRQWIIRAAAAEDMMVVPEGGGDFPANMGMIMDGHSGIEHALSVGQIYDDVVRLFVASHASYTATLLVAYGGQFGENYFYQHDDVWKNAKLQSFFPPRQIDARSRRRMMSDDDDYNHMLVAAGQKKILDQGGLVTLGAHGQLQGLGAHWELWALTQGGMSPRDALRVATRNGAEYLGMQDDLGSLEPGKLADLVVLDANPLDDIHNSERLRYTVSNGVVYDSSSMDQLWPRQVKRGKFHFQK